MAELKTKPGKASVASFIDSLEDPRRRKECKALVRLMKRATGAAPRIWGSGMVGFGSYHYRYASGREGDWFLAGFAPRKGSLTLYVTPGARGHDALLKKLGEVKTGKSCIYVKDLEDVDLNVLEKMVKESVKHLRKTTS